jgi:hypothetical protein
MEFAGREENHAKTRQMPIQKEITGTNEFSKHHSRKISHTGLRTE